MMIKMISDGLKDKYSLREKVISLLSPYFLQADLFMRMSVSLSSL